MKNFFAGLTAGAIGFWIMLLWFPGSTIWMWSSCGQRRLDGWDWVLSVAIPGYGLVRGFTCM